MPPPPKARFSEPGFAFKVATNSDTVFAATAKYWLESTRKFLMNDRGTVAGDSSAANPGGCVQHGHLLGVVDYVQLYSLKEKCQYSRFAALQC